MEKITDKNLIHFLEKLISDIKDEKVSDEELKSISEFYMMYKFTQCHTQCHTECHTQCQTQCHTECTECPTECTQSHTQSHTQSQTQSQKDIKDEKDLLKYLSLGWYIYTNISDCSGP